MWDSKSSLGTGMTWLTKFEDVNAWFSNLRTGMTQWNKFMDQDNTDGQVWELEWSIYEFKDRDDTATQV